MYDRIILADDGSPISRASIPRAAAIAAASGSEVLAVRVSRAAGVEVDDLEGDAWPQYFTEEWLAQAESDPQEAEPHLSEALADLRARGVERVGSLVIHGTPAHALTEATDEFDADLVVMSSRGESGIRRAVLGSVTEYLVRESRETPILLSPQHAEDPAAIAPDGSIRHVMLTLDGSEVSEAAIPHAEHLARSVGAELVLLQVTDAEADIMAASMPVGSPPVATIATEDAQQMAADQQATAAAELGALGATLEERGLSDVSVEVAAGDPAETILATVDRLGIDVVVMATHGRGGLGRLLLGSVADSVMRSIERAAVLLVRPASDDE